MSAATDQNAVCHAGDVFSLRFPILNPDGTAAAFTDPEGVYAIGSRPKPIDGETPLILKTTTPAAGARILQESGTWVLYVDFAEADTQDIAPGVRYHEARIVDVSNIFTVATGTVTVYPTIIREA